MSNALSTIEPDAGIPAEQSVPAESGSVALMRLIERAAMSPEFDVEKLQKLLDVKEKWEANEARKAFVQAVAAFKAHAPKILKTKAVSFGSKDKASYHHATLDQICDVVIPALTERGLFHRWETEQLEGGQIRVTCVLSHVLGHSERVSLQSGPDTSGSKNPIQAIASATTYLSRYTLLMITGLATADMDDDGRKGADFVTADQADTLRALAEEVKADQPKFFAFMRVESFETIPAIRYKEAVSLLEKKRAGK